MDASRMQRISIPLVSLALGLFVFGCGKNTYQEIDPQNSRYGTPQNVYGISQSFGSVELTWNAVQNAEYYKILHGDSPNLDDEVIFTIQTSKTFTGLPRGVNHYFTVLAGGAELEESERSNMIEVHVLNDGEATPTPNPTSTSTPTPTPPPGQVLAPAFFPSSGPHLTPLKVTMASQTPGATIHFSTTGAALSCSSSPSISSGAAAWVNLPVTIQAIACANGMTQSTVSEVTYEAITALAPTFDQPAGGYGTPLQVTMTSQTPGTTIHYSTSGATLNCSSSPSIPSGATVPINLPATVQAISCASGMLHSEVSEVTYTLAATLSTPSFMPGATQQTAPFQVTITSDPGSIIHYNMGANPTNPSCNDDPQLPSPAQVWAITLPVTIKARACANGMNQSAVATVTYTQSSSSFTGQKEWFTVGNTNFFMVYVESGYQFPTEVDDSGSASVADSFEIANQEVTYELWNEGRAWALAHGYIGFSAGSIGSNGSGSTSQPVTSIHWYNALVWTNALTEYYNALHGTNLSCVYKDNSGTPFRVASSGMAWQLDEALPDPAADGFRLPTASEWELAARYQGTDSSYGAIEMPAGSGHFWTPGNFASGATADITNSPATKAVAWFSQNAGGTTHVVGSKNPNTLDLDDMSGNVQEWCFSRSTASSSNRRSPGGKFNDIADWLQIGFYLASTPPNQTHNYLGFRLARTK